MLQDTANPTRKQALAVFQSTQLSDTTPGWAKGEISLTADFDQPMSEEELRRSYDGEVFPK